MSLKPVGPQIESQDINNNFAYLNNKTSQKADFKYVNEALAEIKSDINHMDKGSPSGGFATVSDLQSAYPNGSDAIYLVASDNSWYYWNGGAWAKGGQYQPTEYLEAMTEQNTPWEV